MMGIVDWWNRWMTAREQRRIEQVNKFLQQKTEDLARKGFLRVWLEEHDKHMWKFEPSSGMPITWDIAVVRIGTVHDTNTGAIMDPGELSVITTGRGPQPYLAGHQACFEYDPIEHKTRRSMYSIRYGN
jgi:hypothetical protein